MTIDQAIKLADTLQPNPYPRDMKLRWLAMLDGRIFNEIWAVHEDCPFESFGNYDDADGIMPLLVPAPYDEDVYRHFLCSRMDLENGEAARYNRSVTLFNSGLEAYKKHYRSKHRPLHKGVFRL